MREEQKKLVQIVLVIGILAALLRLGWIYHERREANAPAQPRVEGRINVDYYVVPKKLHAYDLASAREITRQPVWVKEGYRYYYYPYDSAPNRAELDRAAGLLGPLEKVDFAAVETQPTPGEAASRQLLAVFRKDGKQYAVPIGAEQGGNYQINIDEMFFIQDPRELYKHWPEDVWSVIQKHEVRPGMNEIQASFAVGVGVPEPGQGPGKTVNYSNGGNPLQVKYVDGRAVEVRKVKGSSGQSSTPGAPNS